jgi:hypothetical protein
MARRPNVFLTSIAATLVLSAFSAPSAWQDSQSAKSFDAAGPWEGPCRSKDQEMGTLHVEFTRDGRAWRAKGGLRSPGRPSGDSDFEEVKIDGDRVSFVGLWGPMIGEFAGAYKDGKLVGDLNVIRDKKTVSSCAWSLSRIPAKK